MMNMVQVTIGLLLVSVGAATSLAEERVRGSLDILLSTPMSTTLDPGWGSGGAASERVRRRDLDRPRRRSSSPPTAGYWAIYIVLLGLVLAYGAAITSLGLALATWVSRLGRAIALCVTV